MREIDYSSEISKPCRELLSECATKAIGNIRYLAEHPFYKEMQSLAVNDYRWITKPRYHTPCASLAAVCLHLNISYAAIIERIEPELTVIRKRYIRGIKSARLTSARIKENSALYRYWRYMAD